MLVALAVPALALTLFHGGSDPAVVGTATLYSPVTKNAAGVAQAYRFKARSGGRVNLLNVYLHRTSTARTVTVGLYSGSASKAGKRRGQCTISDPHAGAWNRCSMSGSTVTEGKYYWLALLQPEGAKGRLRYRHGRKSSGSVTYLSKRQQLPSLPSRWRNGARRGSFQASIYASTDGTVPPVGAPPAPTPPRGRAPVPPGSPPSPSGWPDASNTGLPLGKTLAAAGALNITQAGAVIDGVDAPSVTVNAPNVTIRNSRIHSRSAWLVRNNSTGLVIEDSELDGEGSNNTAIGSSGFTLRRVEITGSENGMDIGSPGNVTVEDSYIHDLTTANGAHTDGIQIGEGAADLMIRHNTIQPKPDTAGPGATSAIIMWDEGDPQNTRVHIENNRLIGIGAARALYCPRQSASAIYINGNRMRKGVYGAYTDACTVPSHVTEFNGNVDDATGQPVPRG